MPDRRERARLRREARERRRYSGYHRVGVGFVVGFVVLVVLFNVWAQSAIFGLASGLALLALIPAYWLVVGAVHTTASRIARRPLDRGRGYGGTSVDR